MHRSDIETIVDELLAQDPSLTMGRDELAEIVRSFVGARSETRLDPAFKQQLKERLLAAAESAPTVSPNKIISSMKRPVLLACVSLSVVALAAAAAYDRQKIGSTSGVASGVSIRRVGAAAFGSLSAVQLSSEGLARDTSSAAAPMTATSMIAPGEVSTMPAKVGGILKYAYAGSPLSQPDASVEVLRRVRGGMPADAGSIFSSSAFSFLKTDALKGAAVSNVTLYSKEGAYTLETDFLNGRATLYRSEPASRSTLASGSMPGNDRIVAIANDFLGKFGIDTSPYGTPVVSDWKTNAVTAYDVAATDSLMKSDVPAEVTVTYPLILNGKPVYDMGGGIVGMTVGVNAADGTVTSVGNILTNAFEASAYEAETDADRILSFATKGGERYGYVLQSNAEGQVAELGTPQRAYVQTSVQNGRDADELFVPAYVFPVTAKDAGFAPSRVVVPLAKALLKDELPVPMGVPGSTGAAEPMPLTAPDKR